jgi:hypothetical protein
LDAGDFDGDNDLDLVAADLRNNRLHVLENKGNLDFSTITAVVVGSRPFMVLATDVDGNGSLDLVSANSGGNSVSVRLNDGLGVFTPAGDDLRVGNRPLSVAVADFDGDGNPDIAVGNEGSQDISIFAGTGGGNFTFGTILPVLGRPAFVAAGDTDGNGVVDLAMADESGTSVSLFPNLSSPGQFQFGFGAADVGAPSFSLTLGDLDGDTRLDLLTANGAADSISIALGGAEGFGAATVIPVGTTPRRVALADLDGDGAMDLVSANRTSSSLTLLLTADEQPTGVLFTRGDIDGDGGFTITDPTALLNFLFLGGTVPACRKGGDSDDNGRIELTDPVLSLNFLFLGGPAPAPPFDECGLDPTPDDLDCLAFTPCSTP